MNIWKNTKKLKCPHCKSTRLRKEGIVQKRQRYFCKKCGKTSIAPRGGKR